LPEVAVAQVAEAEVAEQEECWCLLVRVLQPQQLGLFLSVLVGRLVGQPVMVDRVAIHHLMVILLMVAATEDTILLLVQLEALVVVD
jgi:hypothetical protein